ncbi:MAG: oligosaccharide flippase family protein [Elusimicrobia bacterium]|jgi:O-antigen/teichoic acid export membrane protein|nr:oligosaccharide flippase family protein [Elusimicrobiota bacterium]
MKNTYSRDSFFLFASEGISGVLFAGAGLLVARTLDVEHFGWFVAAYSLAQIFAVFLDVGMGHLVAKELAAGRDLHHRLTNELLTWRMILLGAVCMVFPLASKWVLASPLPNTVVYSLTAGLFLFGLGDFFCWMLKGAKQPLLAAQFKLWTRGLLLLFCLVALVGSDRLLGFAAAYGVGGLLTAVVAYFLAKRHLGQIRLLPLPKQFFVGPLAEVYKLGALLVVGIFYLKLDVLLVNRFSPADQVGLMGCASRLNDAFRLIPTAAYAAFMPVFSALGIHREQLAQKFTDVFLILLSVSVMIALFGSIFAGPLFSGLLGKTYRESALYFRPLAWGSVFVFGTQLLIGILYAKSDWATIWKGMGVALGLNAVLNILLIPTVGALAAPWTKLVSDAMGFYVQAHGVRQHISVSPRILFLGTTGGALAGMSLWGGLGHGSLFTQSGGALVLLLVLFFVVRPDLYFRQRQVFA